MKQKISITLDEEMIKIVETLLKDAQFRNRSHVIEYSLKKFLNENLNRLDEGK
jgi:Arc/MetJ-type ribon-helix-helix transcriptional regulator